MNFFIFPKLLTPPQAPLHPVTACQPQSLPPPLVPPHIWLPAPKWTADPRVPPLLPSQRHPKHPNPCPNSRLAFLQLHLPSSISPCYSQSGYFFFFK